MSADNLSNIKQRLRDFANERDWDQYHTPKNLSMALSVEAAELMEHFQWLSEAESRQLSADKLKAVSYEMADIFVYLIRIADKLDIDLLATVDEKLVINAQKYPAERVKGSHKKYTEYE
ncbi:MAG: nucleotide pyrophosphohydrolase [Gammaproteobacteria bacterium]|nr:nucleotide pyrophosphohydrolase [Gammaproteobacteria bacterium]